MNLSKPFVLAVAVIVAVAVTSAQDRVTRVPGIDAAGMDLSVRPQDDFFRYVNGRWFDATPIPADQSGYGSFAILRERRKTYGSTLNHLRQRGPTSGAM